MLFVTCNKVAVLGVIDHVPVSTADLRLDKCILYLIRLSYWSEKRIRMNYLSINWRGPPQFVNAYQ